MQEISATLHQSMWRGGGHRSTWQDLVEWQLLEEEDIVPPQQQNLHSASTDQEVGWSLQGWGKHHNSDMMLDVYVCGWGGGGVHCMKWLVDKLNRKCWNVMCEISGPPLGPWMCSVRPTYRNSTGEPLYIVDTIGTQLAVLCKEVSLIQR